MTGKEHSIRIPVLPDEAKDKFISYLSQALFFLQKRLNVDAVEFPFEEWNSLGEIDCDVVVEIKPTPTGIFMRAYNSGRPAGVGVRGIVKERP